jgi:hypothetical protein
MKIVESNDKNGKKIVRLTQKDWETYGRANGWIVKAQEEPEEQQPDIPDIGDEPEDLEVDSFKGPSSYTQFFLEKALEEAKGALGGDRSVFATQSAAIVWLVSTVENRHSEHNDEFFEDLFWTMDDRKIKKVFVNMWDIANNALERNGHDKMPEDGDVSLLLNQPQDYEKFFVAAGIQSLESGKYQEAVNLFRFAGYAFYAKDYSADFRDAGKDANKQFFSKEYAKYEDGYVLNALWPSAQMDLMTSKYDRMPVPEGE